MPTDTAHTTSTEWIVSNKRKRNNYKDTSSHRNLKKKIITPHVESYEEYKKTVSIRDKHKAHLDKWIYDILDGKKEQEKIIYQNDYFLIIPTYVWTNSNNDDLHLLTIPFNKKLRTIRSLNTNYLSLLDQMYKKTLEIIKDKYEIDISDLNIEFHYTPSTYHLHLHFVNKKKEDSSDIHYKHTYNDVINNIKNDENYYINNNLNINLVKFI